MKLTRSYILLVGGVVLRSALAGEVQSATTSLFRVLDTTVVDKGVGGKLAGRAAGWGLSKIGGAIGMGENESKQISQQLDDIEATLTDIDKELKNIKDAINQQTCRLDKNNINTDIFKIQTLMDEYTKFLRETDLTRVPQRHPSLTEIKTWADTVIVDIPVALNNIDVALTSQGNDGILRDCLRMYPMPGNVTDNAFFQQAYALLKYYFGFQTKGVMMVVEAHHYLAWIDAGQPKASSDVATSDVASSGTDICTNHIINIDVQNNCQKANDFTADKKIIIDKQFDTRRFEKLRWNV